MTAGAPRRRLAVAGAGALLATALGCPAARAGGPDAVALARAAYDRGAQAFDAEKYALAAREMTTADELSPNPVALRYALQATLKIDDPVLGMRLVERAAQQPQLATLVGQARAKFARRVGRVALVCGDDPCRARIDGEPAKPVTWVTPGPHALEWEPSGRVTVTIDAGQSVDVSPPPRPAPKVAGTRSANADPTSSATVEPSSDGGGISPTWLWVGIGVTTIAVGATVASGVDTLHQHANFRSHPTPAAQQDGQSAQTRTNVLLGVSAGLAVATAAVGLFAVRWGEPKKPTAALAVGPHGLGLAITFMQ